MSTKQGYVLEDVSIYEMEEPTADSPGTFYRATGNLTVHRADTGDKITENIHKDAKTRLVAHDLLLEEARMIASQFGVETVYVRSPRRESDEPMVMIVSKQQFNRMLNHGKYLVVKELRIEKQMRAGVEELVHMMEFYPQQGFAGEGVSVVIPQATTPEEMLEQARQRRVLEEGGFTEQTIVTTGEKE